MLYEITIFKTCGRKRQRVSAMEVQAPDHVVALERSHINLAMGKVIEIRAKENLFEIERPSIRKVARDGI